MEHSKGLFNALVRGLISLWMIGAGISAENVTAWSQNLLPRILAILAGIWANILIVPTVLALFLGILGLPDTWWEILSNFYNLGQGNPLQKLVFMAGQIFQILVFRPFPCPARLENSLPSILKLFIFRDPERIIPPPDFQLRHAVVKDELWIFVNGVSSTSALAQAHAESLYHIFGRPIWVCYNPTDSILVDILECIVDKVGSFSWFWETKPRKLLAETIEKALVQAEQGKYSRVVVLAHSQGTIITSAALRTKILKGDRRVKEASRKFLEIYAVANCAHQMTVKDTYGVQVVKYIENISNRLDPVAWLGVLFPYPAFWQDQNGKGILLEGNLVTENRLWGHLFNTHYLEPFRKGAYPMSRLHTFRSGRRPDGAMEYELRKRLPEAK